jgi:hypothetical protein
MSARITPTVGRKVYAFNNMHQKEPWDATIVKVWGDGDDPDALVNLHVSDPSSGIVFFWSSVKVGDEFTIGAHYRWMDYQQKQADKAAAAAEAAASQGVST